MNPFFVRSPQEHLQLCYEFAQLSAFGAMLADRAIHHLNQDWLKLKEVSLYPFARTVTLIELTHKGRVECKRFSKIWESTYLPEMEPDWVFQDEFILSKDHDRFFALTQERYEQEKREGRLSEVIRRCPQIEWIDPI